MQPAAGRDHVRLITGNGMVIAPRVPVEWFHVLWRELKPFSVLAYTIPFGQFFDGLLGMDILTHVQAQINVPQQIIEVT